MWAGNWGGVDITSPVSRISTGSVKPHVRCQYRGHLFGIRIGRSSTGVICLAVGIIVSCDACLSSGYGPCFMCCITSTELLYLKKIHHNFHFYIGALFSSLNFLHLWLKKKQQYDLFKIYYDDNFVSIVKNKCPVVTWFWNMPPVDKFMMSCLNQANDLIRWLHVYQV